MAYYINIKKTKTLNNHSAIYQVMAPDTHLFHIKINIDNRIIEVCKNDDENFHILMNFNDPESKIDAPWLSPKIIYALFVKTKEIMASQNFPEDISFCS